MARSSPVRGSVVDVCFESHLPMVNTILRTGCKKKIVIEVLAQLDRHTVRGVALTPTEGLARGTNVEDSREPLKRGWAGMLCTHVRCFRKDD